MKNVSDYIRMLLFEHDYVTVPNLGAFIANYLPSTINDISGSLMPPQKRIAFNEVLKQDDGLLATYIARRESISLEESKRKIHNFVSDVKDSLTVKSEFNFDKIGNFSLNQDRGLVFEPDRKYNFYSESFGFDSIFPKKEVIAANHIIEYPNKFYLEDSYQDFIEKTKEKKGSFTYLMYGLPVMLLMGGLVYILFSNTPANKSSLSSVIPLEFISKSSTSTSSPIKKVIPKPLVIEKNDVVKPDFTAKPADKVETENSPITVKDEVIKPVSAVVSPKVEPSTTKTITISSERYYVVCGMFKNQDNVNKVVTLLQTNGLNPKVVPSKNLLKVIAAEVNTIDEANLISEKLKKLTGERGVIQKN